MDNDVPREGRIAWIFPGQGSQQVGMGRVLYASSPAARALFDTADNVLGRPLAQLCFEGPDDVLRQTINTQPAVFTVSLACLRAAQERGDFVSPPVCVAGHSLGEYAAAVAADALSFEGGLRLVQERGKLMQAAGEQNPGTLAALLGANEEAARQLCAATGVEIANINSAEQIVLGGGLDAVQQATEQARSVGAKRAALLNVSGAFHTSLMQPAATGMAEALTGADLRELAVPLIANGSGAAITTAQQLREELVYQITHPVQWLKSVECMLAQGVERFVEFGPGQVLVGLVRRIDASAICQSCGEAELLAETAQT